MKIFRNPKTGTKSNGACSFSCEDKFFSAFVSWHSSRLVAPSLNNYIVVGAHFVVLLFFKLCQTPMQTNHFAAITIKHFICFCLLEKSHKFETANLPIWPSVSKLCLKSQFTENTVNQFKVRWRFEFQGKSFNKEFILIYFAFIKLQTKSKSMIFL